MHCLFMNYYDYYYFMIYLNYRRKLMHSTFLNMWPVIFLFVLLQIDPKQGHSLFASKIRAFLEFKEKKLKLTRFQTTSSKLQNWSQN